MYDIKRTLIPKKTVVLTLSGTDGTCNITIAGVTKLATFNGTLNLTASDFVYLWASDFLIAGIIITSLSETIIINELVQGAGFDNPIIENLTGTLSASGVASITYPEPITLAEAKTFILDRSDEDSDADTLLLNLITSAREQAELHCNRSFIPQTIEYTENIAAGFGDTSEFTLPYPNHLSLVESKVNDETSTNYTLTGINRFNIRMTSEYYTTGTLGKKYYFKYTAGDCSILAKSAILQIVKDMYENRGKDPMSGNGFKMLQPLIVY